MPKDSRFVCSMFFHAGASDTDQSDFYSTESPLTSDVNMTTAWLRISNTQGNAVYWNKAFATENITTDSYGFDASAKCLYWQNRLNHVFLALTDNNKLKTESGADNGTLNLTPDEDKIYVAYDLTNSGYTSMAEQPDPIRAVETMSPAGTTPEANRVKLFFQHQFSQIQVNVKNAQDGSVSIIDKDLIESVELLGVSDKGYVAYCIDSKGVVPENMFEPANAETTFEMFENTNTATGYVKSYECIAYGKLEGIRIKWKESKVEGTILHEATADAVTERTLESGKKYIFNMELRRGVLAQISAEITPWAEGSSYSAEGSIE